MRAIDADALQLAIVEEGQANKRKKYNIGDIWELTGAEIRDVINSQPTIQPEPHWIPVEQALPEKEGKYLCTRTATWCVDGKATKVTDIAILDYSDNIYDIWKDDGEIFQNGFAFGELWQGKLDNVQKVSAWMPLSAPYQLKNEVTE